MYKIVALFKHERIGTYYTPYQGDLVKNVASGKLYAKYCYLRKLSKEEPHEKAALDDVKN